jgi:hypothetical protein
MIPPKLTVQGPPVRSHWLILMLTAVLATASHAAPAAPDPTLDAAVSLLAGVANTEAPGPQRRLGAAWAYHAQALDQSWQRYADSTYSPIRTWVGKQLPDLEPAVVFYPFSGPDILNAHAFFPRGRSFIMLGLEKIGQIPRPDRDRAAYAREGFKALRGALVNILGMNFFRTQTMGRRIGAHPYSGIAGMMLFFLKRTGHEIISARLIELNESGMVVAEGSLGQRKGLRDHGVQIRFRSGPKGTVRTLYYFRGDVSDKAWTRRPGLAAFVHAQGEMVTFLKAASYLMYDPSFDDIRSTILARSTLVVSEASGMPYHYLARDQSWDIRLFGQYRGPIKLFRRTCQPDLRYDIARQSLGPVPFSFGYNHRLGESHLIVARRKTGVQTREPSFDGSSRYGERTRCHRGRLLLRHRPPPVPQRPAVSTEPAPKPAKAKRLQRKAKASGAGVSGATAAVAPRRP